MQPSLPAPPPHARRMVLLIVAFFLLVSGARLAADYIIEFQWWKEMGQVPTWIEMLIYGMAPVVVATLVAFAVLWLAHARALKFAGTRLGAHRTYAVLSTLALLFVSWVLSSGVIDTWTVVRHFGGRHLPPETSAWRDATFGLPLRFYLFDLPFFQILRSYLLGVAVLSALVYWAAGRGWQLVERLPEIRETGEIDPRIFRLEGGLESRFLRGVGAVVLLAVAFQLFLGRYEMLTQDHGFMVGVDYVAANIALPLQWLTIGACLLAAVFVLAGRWKMAAFCAVAFIIRMLAPPIVSAVYVKPNEISLQRPYIETHIRATRSAYGLEKRVTEREFAASLETRIDISKHKPLLDNVRLWDWRAFHDTITQIQALRPYYVFADTDVDRYMIDGQLRQILLAPRELDITQLPDARTRWINPHFIYTHGYGMVMAESNQITADGLPVLFVQDAPPQIKTPEPEAHATGDLLRRSGPRTCFRAHSAEGVQLSVRLGQCLLGLRRHGRVPDLLAVHAPGGRRARRRL